MDIYKACYVYWIRRSIHTDIKTEGYVGISNNPEKRWRDHGRKNNNTNLGKALEKYDDIVYEIVEKLDGVDEAKAVERSLRPDIFIGWNIVMGGGGGMMTEEIKKKIGKANKGRVHSEESRRNMSVGQQKRALPSEETKKKTRETLKNGKGCKPILIDGVMYPSRNAAIEVYGGSIKSMLRNGTAKYL